MTVFGVVCDSKCWSEAVRDLKTSVSDTSDSYVRIYVLDIL